MNNNTLACESLELRSLLAGNEAHEYTYLSDEIVEGVSAKLAYPYEHPIAFTFGVIKGAWDAMSMHNVLKALEPSVVLNEVPLPVENKPEIANLETIEDFDLSKLNIEVKTPELEEVFPTSINSISDFFSAKAMIVKNPSLSKTSLKKAFDNFEENADKLLLESKYQSNYFDVDQALNDLNSLYQSYLNNDEAIINDYVNNALPNLLSTSEVPQKASVMDFLKKPFYELPNLHISQTLAFAQAAHENSVLVKTIDNLDEAIKESVEEVSDLLSSEELFEDFNSVENFWENKLSLFSNGILAAGLSYASTQWAKPLLGTWSSSIPWANSWVSPSANNLSSSYGKIGQLAIADPIAAYNGFQIGSAFGERIEEEGFWNLASEAWEFTKEAPAESLYHGVKNVIGAPGSALVSTGLSYGILPLIPGGAVLKLGSILLLNGLGGHYLGDYLDKGLLYAAQSFDTTLWKAV